MVEGVFMLMVRLADWFDLILNKNSNDLNLCCSSIQNLIQFIKLSKT